MTEFSDLSDEYTTTPGNLIITGDFNLQYDQPNNTEVSHVRTLLHDNRLWQVLDEPTHWHSHTLDWLVVHEAELSSRPVSWTTCWLTTRLFSVSCPSITPKDANVQSC